MKQSVHIPPDVARVLEAFWKEQLRQEFGHTPPTAKEELAYIGSFRERGLPVVPLRDGSRVSVGPTGRGAAVGDDRDLAEELPIQRPNTTPLWKWAALGGLVLLAALPLVGPPLRRAAAGIFGASRRGSGGEASSEPLADVRLPEDINSLVTSGNVNVPLVVPRTLEIKPSGSLTSTTFVVVPVEVEEADWPCPSRKFKGRPAACWVFGSVVNYLIGIPREHSQAEPLLQALASGGSAWLRMSTEQVLSFSVSPAAVSDVERHRTEVLRQDHFGLTLVGLGGEGQRRPVAVASYVPDEIAGASPAPLRTPPQGGRPVALGSSVRLSDDLTMTPLRVRTGSEQHELWIGLRGEAEQWPSHSWRAWGVTHEQSWRATVTRSSVNRVVLAVEAPDVEAWIVEASGGIYRVVPEM